MVEILRTGTGDGGTTIIDNTLWTRVAPTHIYPTAAGDYGATGLQITDLGNLSMDGSLVVDTQAGIGAGIVVNTRLNVQHNTGGPGTDVFGVDIYSQYSGITSAIDAYGIRAEGIHTGAGIIDDVFGGDFIGTHGASAADDDIIGVRGWANSVDGANGNVGDFKSIEGLAPSVAGTGTPPDTAYTIYSNKPTAGTTRWSMYGIGSSRFIDDDIRPVVTITQAGTGDFLLCEKPAGVEQAKIDEAGNLNLLLQNQVIFFDADNSNFASISSTGAMTEDTPYLLPDSYGDDGDVLTLLDKTTGQTTWTENATGGPTESLWTRVDPTHIYPTDAGDYGATGMQITDAGSQLMDGDMTIDGIGAVGVALATNVGWKVDKTFTLTGDNAFAIVGDIELNNATNSAFSAIGAKLIGNHSGDGDALAAVGLTTFAQHTGDGDVNIVASIVTSSTTAGATAGNVTDMYGIHVDVLSSTNPAPEPTRARGIRIDRPLTGTTRWALYSIGHNYMEAGTAAGDNAIEPVLTLNQGSTGDVLRCQDNGTRIWYLEDGGNVIHDSYWANKNGYLLTQKVDFAGVVQNATMKITNDVSLSADNSLLWLDVTDADSTADAGKIDNAGTGNGLLGTQSRDWEAENRAMFHALNNVAQTGSNPAGEIEQTSLIRGNQTHVSGLIPCLTCTQASSADIAIFGDATVSNATHWVGVTGTRGFQYMRGEAKPFRYDNIPAMEMRTSTTPGNLAAVSAPIGNVPTATLPGTAAEADADIRFISTVGDDWDDTTAIDIVLVWTDDSSSGDLKIVTYEIDAIGYCESISGPTTTFTGSAIIEPCGVAVDDEMQYDTIASLPAANISQNIPDVLGIKIQRADTSADELHIVKAIAVYRSAKLGLETNEIIVS